MEKETIIKAEHLFKKYGSDETEILALNDVNFEICKGEFTAVTGESGSGKTTLLNIVGSLDRLTSGHIIVNGTDIAKKNDNELSAYRRRNI